MVLLLGPGLEVRAQTPQTRHYLARLLPPADAGRAPVPAVAYNAAAQLLAVEAGVDDHPPSTRVHLGDGRWLTLRAARIGAGAVPGERDIAVTVEDASPADRLAVFAAAFGLTPRETQVLRHLAAGDGSREIALALVVSEHTVHDHVKSMLAKTGTRSRAGLVSAAVSSPTTGPARATAGVDAGSRSAPAAGAVR